MKRNKYLNTFDTTTEYDNYIESALPEFPNVGLTKDDGKLHYMRRSPNDHYIYGELIDSSITAPSIYRVEASPSSTTSVLTSVDTVSNTFYYDNLLYIKVDEGYSMYPNGLFGQNDTIKSNIKNIKKLNIDITKLLGSPSYMFYNLKNVEFIDLTSFNNYMPGNIQFDNVFSNCAKLRSIDFTGWDLSNIVKSDYAFSGCSSLTDVYITVEATLMKLTNNLTSQSGAYIPASATIHYNDVDYKWQNNAWTPQS